MYMARHAAFDLLLAYHTDGQVAVSALGTECYTWAKTRESIRSRQELRIRTIANGTIPGQSRRRTGPSAAAGGARGFRSRGPRPVHAAGISGVLGQAPDLAERGRGPVRAARPAATLDVSYIQSAVSDAD